MNIEEVKLKLEQLHIGDRIRLSYTSIGNVVGTLESYQYDDDNVEVVLLQDGKRIIYTQIDFEDINKISRAVDNCGQYLVECDGIDKKIKVQDLNSIKGMISKVEYTPYVKEVSTKYAVQDGKFNITFTVDHKGRITIRNTQDDTEFVFKNSDIKTIEFFARAFSQIVAKVEEKNNKQ